MANEPANPAGGEGEGQDADAMAAEWEKMAAADGDAPAEGAAAEAAPAGEGEGDAPAGSTRVLNQDEIDSLLGFNEETAAGGDRSGIRAILDSSLVSYERLPMLEVVFDRLVRMMSTSLRNFTSDNVEVSLDSITSVRFGDYLNSIPLPAMMAVYQAEQWDNYGLLTVDSALIYSIVDVLLGGRRGTAAMRIEGRPYTTIERNLVERMIHLVLADLCSAFEPLTPVNFKFERLETNPRFATIARPGNAAILARLRIDMDDRGGRLEILLPYATIEPVREVLLQRFMGEKFGRDSIWETHLANELKSTEVQIEAVLDEMTMTLREIMAWQVGTQVLLNSTPNSPIDLRCGSVSLFSGNMGRKGLQVAIRIDERIMKTDDGE
ncbi:MAG: flagellar motor switch protein FliM [Alphaproteobacteria bacterium]|nr:flagellar motor switch protein FliM [Alphaproteobacteria bacterium]